MRATSRHTFELVKLRPLREMHSQERDRGQRRPEDRRSAVLAVWCVHTQTPEEDA